MRPCLSSREQIVELMNYAGLDCMAFLFHGHMDVRRGSNGGSGAPVDRVQRLVGGTERLRAGMGDQWAG